MENSKLFEEIKTNWDGRFNDVNDNLEAVMRSTDQSKIHTICQYISEKLNLDLSDKILDVGCGVGVLLSELDKNVDIAYGVDYSREAIKRAKTLYSGIDFSVSEAADLSFKSDMFDKVLCYSVFHYFTTLKYSMEAIDELLRVCKPGGMILLGDLPSKNHFHLSPYFVKKNFKYYYRKLRSMLKKLIKKSDSEPSRLPYKDVTHWLWFDLPKLERKLMAHGHKVEILSQPDLMQYSEFTANHRFDLLIEKSS